MIDYDSMPEPSGSTATTSYLEGMTYTLRADISIKSTVQVCCNYQSPQESISILI
jgi:hypothetical protein